MRGGWSAFAALGAPVVALWLGACPSGEMFTSASPQELATGANGGFALITGGPRSLVVFTSSIAGRDGLSIAQVPF